MLLPILEFENRSTVQTMLEAGEKSSADLSDLLILASARQADWEALLTFDKKVAKTPGVELLA
jgi:predicted nucleic acid-binding protein